MSAAAEQSILQIVPQLASTKFSWVNLVLLIIVVCLIAATIFGSIYYLQQRYTFLNNMIFNTVAIFILAIAGYVVYSFNVFGMKKNSAIFNAFLPTILITLTLMTMYTYIHYVAFGDLTKLTTMGSFVGISALVILLFVFIIFIIHTGYRYWAYPNTSTDYIAFFLNFFIGAVFLGIVANYVGGFGDEILIVRLLKNLVFYIPCFISDIFVFIMNQYTMTPNVAWTLLTVEALLVLAKFLYSFLKRRIVNHDGLILVDKSDARRINHRVGLVNYTELTKTKPVVGGVNGAQAAAGTSSTGQKYQYAISMWIYLNPSMASIRSEYESYNTLFSFADKPAVKYMPATNTIRFTTKNISVSSSSSSSSPSVKEDIELAKWDEVPLQRWNHIVINYDGAATDIFINGQLFSSKPGIIQYGNSDDVFIGDDNHLNGGIRDVVYFNHPITASNIKLLYEA